MRQFTVMIKPASSLCNMRCKYCFYRDVSENREVFSYGFMSKRTAKKILFHCFCGLTAGDKITFAFQGGEPMLAGLSFFKYFTSEAERARGNIETAYTIQTNGTLINEAWCEFFSKRKFLVGLSFDGSEEIHDSVRLDEKGEGTYRKILKGKELLERYQIDYNILAVLTNELAADPGGFWEEILRLNVSYVQLIPCLDELNGTGGDGYGLTPQRFASFYIALFDLWKRDWQRGKRVSVKLFDDICNLISQGICTACGMTGDCSPQIVVEADGSAYPCDFYVLDEYRLGKLTEQSLTELLSSEQMRKFLSRPDEKPGLCKTCSYRYLCGGGCRRMRKEMCGTKNGLACGYKQFLDARIF